MKYMCYLLYSIVPTLALQSLPSPHNHHMRFKFEPGQAYDVQNNGSMITVRDDEMRTVLYEWIPYTCHSNPYAVKTIDRHIVLEFNCPTDLQGVRFDVVTI